MCLSFRYR